MINDTVKFRKLRPYQWWTVKVGESRFWMLLGLFIFYLVWRTGIHSDDYPLIQIVKGWEWSRVLFPPLSDIGVIVFGPVSYYFSYLQYKIFGTDYLLAYDLIKGLSTLGAVWMTYKFALYYITPPRAILAAVAFILYPTHDATVYWSLTLVYALVPAMLLYSHHLIRDERYRFGVLVGAVASFTSYASPPYSFGLAVIFIAERAYRKAALFLLPGVVYVTYYFMVKQLPGVSKGRIVSGLDVAGFLKQYFIQCASFADAALGPSFWLKWWYSLGANTLVTVALTLAMALWAVSQFRDRSRPSVQGLMLGLGAVLLLAFGMFALTGYYPQMAFNLGNRVTVYGALLLAFGFAILPRSPVSYGLVVACLLLPVLGLSNHWKSWNDEQQRVFSRIHDNVDLRSIKSDQMLLVTGYAYSKLGNFSHIEFMSEEYMVQSLMRHALGHAPDFPVHTVTRRHQVERGVLLDRKYGTQIPLLSSVVIYDLRKNIVRKMTQDELKTFLVIMPKETRHWLQLMPDLWVNSLLFRLAPRLRYLTDE